MITQQDVDKITKLCEADNFHQLAVDIVNNSSEFKVIDEFEDDHLICYRLQFKLKDQSVSFFFGWTNGVDSSFEYIQESAKAKDKTIEIFEGNMRCLLDEVFCEGLKVKLPKEADVLTENSGCGISEETVKAISQLIP